MKVNGNSVCAVERDGNPSTFYIKEFREGYLIEYRPPNNFPAKTINRNFFGKLKLEASNATCFTLHHPQDDRKLDISCWEDDFCFVKVNGHRKYLGWKSKDNVIKFRAKCCHIQLEITG